MRGFKDFLMRGNLLEVAVAFVIGGAFGKVVESFTKLFMDLISKLIGGEANFDSVTVAGIAIGPFITAIVNFVIVAAVIYFLIVKPVNAIRERNKPAEEAVETTEIDLLVEIRDLLAVQDVLKKGNTQTEL